MKYIVNATDDYDVTHSHNTWPNGTNYTFRNTTSAGDALYYRARHHYFIDEIETSSVSFEGITKSITNSILYNSSIFTGTSEDSSTLVSGQHIPEGNNPHLHINYTEYSDHIENGYHGSLDSFGYLGTTEINTALINGRVNFDIAAPNGDFLLNSVTLVVETSPVPVPATAWLFGTGLIGLFRIAKRKQH